MAAHSDIPDGAASARDTGLMFSTSTAFDRLTARMDANTLVSLVNDLMLLAYGEGIEEADRPAWVESFAAQSSDAVLSVVLEHIQDRVRMRLTPALVTLKVNVKADREKHARARRVQDLVKALRTCTGFDLLTHSKPLRDQYVSKRGGALYLWWSLAARKAAMLCMQYTGSAEMQTALNIVRNDKVTSAYSTLVTLEPEFPRVELPAKGAPKVVAEAKPPVVQPPVRPEIKPSNPGSPF